MLSPLPLLFYADLVACSSTSSNADTNSDSASSVDQEQPMQGNPDATPAETSDEAPASVKTETEEVSWDPEVFNLDDDIDHYLGNYGVPGNVPSYNLPLVDEPVTLTYFYTNQFVQECGFESLAENEMWKQVMDMTGINIVFRHHDPNSAQEKLSLMLASNDLTDLVQDLNTLKTSRSLDSAVEEGLFVDLMMYPELIPHLMGVLESSDILMKNATTDSARLGRARRAYPAAPGLPGHGDHRAVAGLRKQDAEALFRLYLHRRRLHLYLRAGVLRLRGARQSQAPRLRQCALVGVDERHDCRCGDFPRHGRRQGLLRAASVAGHDVLSDLHDLCPAGVHP